jgi:hypothetical protein
MNIGDNIKWQMWNRVYYGVVEEIIDSFDFEIGYKEIIHVIRITKPVTTFPTYYKLTLYDYNTKA